MKSTSGCTCHEQDVLQSSIVDAGAKTLGLRVNDLAA